MSILKRYLTAEAEMSNPKRRRLINMPNRVPNLLEYDIRKGGFTLQHVVHDPLPPIIRDSLMEKIDIFEETLRPYNGEDYYRNHQVTQKKFMDLALEWYSKKTPLEKLSPAKYPRLNPLQVLYVFFNGYYFKHDTDLYAWFYEGHLAASAVGPRPTVARPFDPSRFPSTL